MELGSSSFSSYSSSSGKNSASAADSSLSIGLKIGQEGYVKSGNGSSASGAPSSPAKKGRSGGVAQGGQPARCQVEGCNADLSDAKAYYSRHKVCAMHSKSPTVIVAGLEQRFCQQCSRFHQLPEFDQGKRSCRRRLAGHNERRRKPPPGTLFSARYGSLSSPLFDNSSKGSGAFLMDFTSYQNPSGRDSSWADPRAFGPAWDGRSAPPSGRFLQHGWQSNSDDTTPPELLLQASPFPGPANNVHPSSGECFDGVPSSNRALSLLSSQPLGLEVTSFLGADGTPASGSQGAGLNGFSDPQWGFKVSQGSSSAGDGHYSGELGMGHQTENVREYMGLEQSTRGYDSSMQDMHWTL